MIFKNHGYVECRAVCLPATVELAVSLARPWSMFGVGSAGGAQVFRQSAYLSGRVQSLLFVAARAIDDAVAVGSAVGRGRESGAGPQPSLQVLRLRTTRLP